jgi:hypothetical protein
LRKTPSSNWTQLSVGGQGFLQGSQSELDEELDESEQLEVELGDEGSEQLEELEDELELLGELDELDEEPQPHS